MKAMLGKLHIRRKAVKPAALLMALALVLMALIPAPAPVKADAGLVRVRLSIGDVKTLSVSVTGAYRIAETGREFSGGKLTFTGSGSSVTVSHSALGTLYSGSSVTVEKKDLRRDAGSKLTFNVSNVTRSYLGHLAVTASDGKLRAVNHVPVNHYLYGVVAFEMSNAFPVEALKAQAIAAKNYVVPLMGSSGSYDVGDTSSDQVYKGYVASYTNVIEAVDATVNEVLLLNGAIMPCWFSASNGGYMIKPSTAWHGTTVYDAGYSEGVDEYDLENLSTPQENLPLPTVLDPAQFGNDTFYSLVEAAYRKAAAETLPLPEGAVPGETVRISDAVSVRADGSDSVLYGDGDRVRITAVSTYTLPEEEVPVEAPAAQKEEKATPAPTATPASTATPAPASTATPAPVSGRAIQPSLIQGGIAYAQAPSAKTNAPAANGEVPAEEPSASPESAPAVSETEETPAPAAGTDDAAVTEEAPCETGVCTDAPPEEEVPVTEGTEADGAPAEEPDRPIEEPAPVEPTVYEVPVTFTLKYEDLASAGLFVRTNLRLYTVRPSDGGFTILHSRYGHGIGLSQRGAQQMAKEGFTYREIIAYYYGGATLAPFPYTTPEEAAKATPVPQSTPAVTATPVPGNTPAAQNTPAAAGVPGLVSASNVKLRKTASSSGKVIATLDKNTLLSVAGFNGSFYAVRVDAGGKAGFVDTGSVTLLGDNVLCRGTVCGDDVNVRSGPSTKYTSLGKVNTGDTVSVRGMSSGWYRLTVDATGTTGYVTARYVSLDTAKADPPAATATPSPTPTPAPAPTPAPDETPVTPEAAAEGEQSDTTVYGQINAARVNFRTGPSTSNTSMGRYSKGEQLIVYGKTGNWYRVRVLSAKKDGYVYAKYVTLLPQESSASATAKTAAKASIDTGLLNLRSKPSTSSSSRVLMSLRRGYEVTVHSVSGSWAFVTYNGTSGYCIAKCVKMS